MTNVISEKYKIVIDSSSRIFYASFYIQGLITVFGKQNISFSSKEFKALNRHKEQFAFEHYFALLIKRSDGKFKKIVVDFCDPIDINEAAYYWCDVYAKVNYNKSLTAEKYHCKALSIAPGFGIKIWDKQQTFYYCFSNLFKLKFKPLTSIKRFFQDYYAQYNRPTISYYEQNNLNISNKNYVFMIASLWNDHETMSSTNQFRKQFVEACKKADCEFEGGFYTSSDANNPIEFKDLLFHKPYKTIDYVTKTQNSKFVFNTPAVHQCHGWKLGEYLAMGKAIISTPLSNDLPFLLEHKKNIHVVSNENELDSAIINLLENDDYVRFLEKKSKEYYRTYCSPLAVINSIVAKSGI